jgi:hypothetical protein
MKIRTSFVSNSSSSSFVIVGFTAGEVGFIRYDQLMQKLGVPTEGSEEWAKWSWSGGCGGYGIFTLDKRIVATNNYDCFGIVGIDAANQLNKDMRVSEIAKELADYIQSEYGVKLDPSKFRLEFGEAGSE